jgi:hypothetical protein
VEATEVMPMRINRWQYYYIIVLVLLLTGVFISGCSCGESKSPAILQSGTATTEITQKGDPDWWKKQTDLKQEESAINETLSEVRSAFTAQDIEKILACFVEEERETYKAFFSKSQHTLPEMAKDLENTSLSFLSPDMENYNRFAEYTFSADGKKFYIVFIKIDGKWLIRDF